MGKHGENIRQRADGRWEARVVVPGLAGGKTKYKYLYGRTCQEVRERKQAFLLSLAAMDEPMTDDTMAAGNAEIMQTLPQDQVAEAFTSLVRGLEQTTTPVQSTEQAIFQVQSEGQTGIRTRDAAPQILFADVATAWLDLKKATVRESTYACYASMVRNHILPELGSRYIYEVTDDLLSDFLLSKKRHGGVKDSEPLSAKTVADLKAILRQILSYARSRGLIRDIPSCPSLNARQPDIQVLTRQEQQTVEQAALREATPFTLGILLSLYGGLRIGEVCALKWADFDFTNGTVRIEKTAFRISQVEEGAAHGTKLTVGSPKTDCSIRTVPLPETVFSYLKKHRAMDNAYVITGPEKLMEPRLCLARFKRFLKRNGVAYRSWHCLRHTFATRCVESGVDVKSLSEMMGHSNVKITMQRYVHPSLDVKKEQVNKLPCFDESGQISSQESGQVSGQKVVR